MPQPWLGNPTFFPQPPVKVVSRSLIPPPPSNRGSDRREARVRMISGDGKWQLVRRKIPPAPRLTPPATMTAAERIIFMSCVMYGITKAELLGETRSVILVSARLYAAVRLRRELGLSFPHIGKLLHRDHSSIINLLRRADGVSIQYRNGRPKRFKPETERTMEEAR